MSEDTKSGCEVIVPEIKISEVEEEVRKQSDCSENSVPEIRITDSNDQTKKLSDSSVKSIPDIRIAISEPEKECDKPSQTEEGTRFLIYPVKERKLSSHQTNLSDISEDEAMDDFRTRKVSIMAGNPEVHHYIPHHHQVRKVSTDSFYLSPYVVPRSRKSSMDAFYCQPPPHQRMSVVSIVSSNQDTFEATPHADHYKDIFSMLPEHEVKQRPTLHELRDDTSSGPRSPRATTSVRSDDLFADELEDKPAETPTKRTSVSTGLKFGWIQGVLVRCLLNIFGVMLFLRLTWVTGQAGIGFASVIVLLSAVVTIITTASMSAICTNGEVKGGGAYYMISRSLGPEFGGSIGVVFSLANAIAAAMYIVGFAETVQDLMKEFDTTITGDRMHDVRIIGCATAVVLLAIVVIGMEWEAKAQLGLLVILVIAIINFFVGTFIPPSTEHKWKGVVGYSAEVFTNNFGPDFREGNSFFSVFSIFFPAATGILAGANISGDLRDPQAAIPKGTFLAIIITTVVYLGMAWSAGGCMIRDAVGPIIVSSLGNQTNVTIPIITPTLDVISDCSAFNKTCEYGLQNDNGAVGLASAFRPLILAGIFSATLSSALASMVGAPKVFQALGKDKLFPLLEFFSKGYGRGGEPRRGYILTFFICVAMTCIGALDLIAPIISNFFLMAYTLINYSCFHASMANTPGFRPAFKYYNRWVSLIGALVCLAVMFLINWWAALVTFLIVGALYLYVAIKKPDVNWGSSTQAYAYRDALKSTMKLVKIEEHVKNFRPQILVMSGYPRNRPALMDFASLITKKQSLLISGHIFRGEMSEHVKNLRSTAAYKWFEAHKIKAFYNSVVAPTLRIGSQVLMQALGVGKLRPNTIMLGYKNDWIKSDPYDVEDYVNIVHDAFDLHYGVGILRVPDGLDVNKVPDDLVGHDDDIESDVGDYSDEDDQDDEEKSPSASESQTTDTSTSFEFPGENYEGSSYKLNNKSKDLPNSKHSQNHVVLKRLNTVDEGLENKAFEADTESKFHSRPTMQTLLSTVSSASSGASRFRNKLYGSIDVWWLYDDGGLTLLIPYILSTRKKFKNCQLRVFFAGSKKGKPDEEQIRMAALLSKFRIDYSQLTIVSDLWKKPSLNVYKEFDSIIRKWRLRPGEFYDAHPWKIRDGDLLSHKHRTYRNLRLREELLVHSSEASLIFMTLPMPRKVECPAGLYMGWLEMLSRDMPPMLLLRGNQQSVLTYYS